MHDNRQKLVVAQGEIERLKSEILRSDMRGQQAELDLNNKKNEMETEFIEMSKRNVVDSHNQRSDDSAHHQKSALERELWEGERMDLQKKIKLLNRKIEELIDEVKLLNEQNIELKSDKNRVTLQLEEMRSAFRNKLTKYMNENNKDSSAVTWSAKEELIRSYTEKEVDMSQRLEKECQIKVQKIK